MKKLLILTTLCVVMLGCSPETKTMSYVSDELGIQFDYPEAFGPPQERRDEAGNLNGLIFDPDLTEGALELRQEDESMIIETCSSIPMEVVTEKCEVMMVEDRPFIIYQGHGDLDAAQLIQLQTRQGVWSFSTGNPKAYDAFIDVAKTVQYLDQMP